MQESNEHYFDFDFDNCVVDKLINKLVMSPIHPLVSCESPNSPGVYALYNQGKLVYIGKASKIRKRLCCHRLKLSGRKNISVDEVSCRYLVFSNDWFPLAAESILIAHLKPIWNNSGFGTNPMDSTGDFGVNGWWYDAYPKISFRERVIQDLLKTRVMVPEQ